MTPNEPRKGTSKTRFPSRTSPHRSTAARWGGTLWGLAVVACFGVAVTYRADRLDSLHRGGTEDDVLRRQPLVKVADHVQLRVRGLGGNHADTARERAQRLTALLVAEPVGAQSAQHLSATAQQLAIAGEKAQGSMPAATVSDSAAAKGLP